MIKTIFLSALLPLLLACGGSADSPSQEDTSLSRSPEDIIEKVGRTLPAIRDLKLLRPLEPNFLSESETADYLRQQLDEEVREELAKLQELYLALGLMEEGQDLYSLYLALLDEQVVGVFDPETEELYVLTDGGEGEELILAHEVTHALQQQHFNILELGEEVEGNIDRELALSALIEGDATLAMLLYQQSESLPLSESGHTTVFDNAPFIVQETFLFPYFQGTEFVAFLWQDNQSWGKVGAVYGSPPQSTEQVLHPEKYLAGEAPTAVTVPDLLPSLGTGWEQVLSGVIGEFFLSTYLNSELSDRDAEAAASGWGGDRVVLYQDEQGLRTLVLLTQWDTLGDADEFFEAYGDFTAKVGNWQQKETGRSSLRWGQPSRWVYLGQSGHQVLVILAPSDGVVDDLLAHFARF